ncbi:amidohydrolase family protein [Lysobacter korlensis]|uniref:Amidohydrolase family protein n=1 Tax=Lysobacter korlensis TaxID=553636 RepID=A0ABV6S035_9GAMM
MQPVNRISCAALALACGLGFALSPSSAQARDVLIVRAGNLFDSKDGVMRGSHDLLIEDGRVVQVARKIDAPPNARVVDLSQYAVLPGLIDAHAHLLMEHPGNEGAGETGIREVVREGDALRALRGAARARSYLEEGFTSVRDLGNSGRFADVALRRAISEGVLPGPRLYVSGPGLAPHGGQLDGIGPGHGDIAAHEYREVAGADDARSAVREGAVQGVDQIKLYANASPNPTSLTVAEMRAAVEEASGMGLTVTAHATSDRAIGAALDAGVRTIEHGRGASAATLARMKREDATFVATEWSRGLIDLQLAQLPESQRPPASRIEGLIAESSGRIAAARSAGVEIAFGSDVYVDFGVPRGEAARLALDSFVEAGMSPAQALRSATFVAGRTVKGADVGELKPGARADLIAVEGDPTKTLSTLADLRCVIIDGQIRSVPGATCSPQTPGAR